MSVHQKAGRKDKWVAQVGSGLGRRSKLFNTYEDAVKWEEEQ